MATKSNKTQVAVLMDSVLKSNTDNSINEIATNIKGISGQPGDNIAIDHKLLRFLMTEYISSLGGSLSPTGRAERLYNQLEVANSHNEINIILQDDLSGAAIQELFYENTSTQ